MAARGALLASAAASCIPTEQVMPVSCTLLSDGSTMSIIRSAYIGLLATLPP